MLIPIPLKDQVNDVIFTIMWEVDVDVREFVHRHPLSIQESPKVEIEADGTHATDAQTVADQ
ncbi:hypothetical protein BGE01nite_31720 [Brevifollis gellanilyticus]|uniref:Uncharacterized protein n=1 Tax=Brevifollis gellanilyticus TaxID=748831 RepID=A0A512MC09_9BACT|nr:hypothetical protein BGE01nite_31720 [Brevifollis gellanilyticus]